MGPNWPLGWPWAEATAARESSHGEESTRQPPHQPLRRAQRDSGTCPRSPTWVSRVQSRVQAWPLRVQTLKVLGVQAWLWGTDLALGVQTWLSGCRPGSGVRTRLRGIQTRLRGIQTQLQGTDPAWGVQARLRSRAVLCQ